MPRKNLKKLNKKVSSKETQTAKKYLKIDTTKKDIDLKKKTLLSSKRYSLDQNSNRNDTIKAKSIY